MRELDLSALQVSTTEEMGAKLQRLQQIALVLGVIGLVLCVLGWFVDGRGFFHSYLWSYTFWLGASGGALIWLMVHHVVGGGWGFVIRRELEAATRLIPWLLLLFVPILIGLWTNQLYSWTTPPVSQDPSVVAKSGYLNLPFFTIRVFIFFGIWIALEYYLNRWGAVFNERDDIDLASRLNKLASGGLVVYALVATLAAIDWLMSLTPTWYSTIFGLLVLVSQATTGLAMMLWLYAYVLGDKPLIREVPSGYYRDLGNLLIVCVMLWGYMSFSQYLLTFTANSTDEVTWYVARRLHGWGAISLFLIPGHFFFPFLILLVGSDIKRNPLRLRWVALWLLLMRVVDIFWWVTPTFHSHLASAFQISDLGAWLFIGGVWLWLWARNMYGHPLIPLRDPRIEGRSLELVQHG